MKTRLIILFALCSAIAHAGVVNYTADDQSIFPNPERGFTEELGGETKLSNSKNHVVQPEADWFFDLTDPDNADRQSQSLVVLMYYLSNYKSQDLSTQLLQGFDEDMQILRSHGFKCVLRFAYDWKSKNDAELTWVKRHIAQLKPHLASNKDVIYVIETGFVGQWGEWYYSSHFGNETQELNADRRQVLEAMLDACPSDRFLLVRYPLIKLSYLGDEQPLDSAEAFTGSARARIGHHNDAFLNAWGNDGTYGRNGDGPDDDPVLRNYIAAETLYVPNGGETNVEDNDDTPGLPEQVYARAVEEMALYHWSFCGSTYSEEVTDRWRANGIFDQLNRHMGYRYQLVQAVLPETAVPSAQVQVQLAIRNVGYAPLYNERHAYLVLQPTDANQSSIALPLASDPRRWLPNGEQTTINEWLTIPADAQEGTYDLYLHLPDLSPSLSADPRYAVRFANVGTWEPISGMNSLNASITIEAGTVDLESATSPSAPSIEAQRILRNGQVFILRGEKVYTVTGQEVK